ncbi:ABC transporter permease [Spirillospora sp. NPDC048819]|uniref:ABC transporter permease n=1 Tax=Spirillospora sp. NPDC048819 TaxID=3155268 RepID=UPI0033E371F0
MRIPTAAIGLAALAGGAVVLARVLPDEATALLLGTGTGCLISAIALTIVLTFRGSGTVNFAAGAMAMEAAYVYDDLRRSGTLFPTDLSLGGPLGVLPAMVVALIASALLGALCHVLVFRPLRSAPPLSKVVASVGVLIVLQAIALLRYGSTPRSLQPILSKTPVRLSDDIIVPGDQLLLAGIVVVLTIALWAVFRFTRFGLATRAAAENERAATLLGFSPDFLAGANWILSAVLAGFLGILVATVNGSLDPVTITLLVVPALGAALLGGLTSFGVATAAGLGIAMTQSLIQVLSLEPWFPQAGSGPLPGVRETVPFVVIVIALVVRGQTLPTRGTVSPVKLPEIPRPRRLGAGAVVVAGGCAAGLLTLGPVWRLAITNTLIGALICLSLVVLTGYVGQISLAQMTLAGVSGFVLAKLASGAGVPFPLAPLAGALVATVFGLAMAVPALRVRGVNLAILTLAGGVAVEKLVFGNPAWSGGLEGAQVPSPALLGVSFGPRDPSSVLGDGKLPSPWFGIFCLAVVMAAAAGVANLHRSATGRRMLAVRSNERAAAAAGVSVAGTKLLAFGLAAFIAGLGGALSGYRFGSVSPEFFGGVASLTFLAYAYLGGITSLSGAGLGGFLVAGGVGFTALKQWVHVGDRWTLLVTGIGLVATAVMNPEGMAGALRETRRRLTRRKAVAP